MSRCLKEFEESRSEVLLHAYLIKLLTLLGYMASWDTCSRSHQKLCLTEPLFLSMRDASVIRCGYAEGADIRLTPSVIKWVNYMQKEDFDALKRVTPSHGEKAEVYLIMRTVFGNIFSFPFKSEAFLQAVSH